MKPFLGRQDALNVDEVFPLIEKWLTVHDCQVAVRMVRRPARVCVGVVHGHTDGARI